LIATGAGHWTAAPMRRLMIGQFGAAQPPDVHCG
jgi:hypothetical protein